MVFEELMNTPNKYGLNIGLGLFLRHKYSIFFSLNRYWALRIPIFCILTKKYTDRRGSENLCVVWSES